MQDDQPYDKDWEAEAPFLAKLPKQRPGGIPDGYFERLPNQIMDKIRSGEQAEMPVAEVPAASPVVAFKSSRPSLLKQTRFWALAASLALLLAATWAFWPAAAPEADPDDLAFQQQLSLQLASMDAQVVLAALNESDVSEEDVYALLGADDQSDLGIQGDGAEVLDYLEHEDLEEFDLDQLNIDPSELL